MIPLYGLLRPYNFDVASRAFKIKILKARLATSKSPIQTLNLPDKIPENLRNG